MTETIPTQVAGPSNQSKKTKDKKRLKDHKHIALWTSLGVNDGLATALVSRGLKRPTPIQRTCIPSAFTTPRRDIVGTSRTGSGKTLAYLIPLIQHIQQSTRPRSSPSAIILCPNRELALQILRVGKALCRNLDSAGGEAGHIQWTLAVGGDGMESQFAALSDSPDIIVATPGRFLHLIVEMEYDLRQVHHVVYDEADRLFEMGFKPQVDEILLRLPVGRHSLLYSATLPPAVSDFARAGLSNPILHQLDNEQSLSPDLKLGFFWTTPVEKPAALLAVLQTIVGIQASEVDADQSAQVMVFAATKHHVEYLTTLLRAMAYRVSFIYGSLHQLARKEQLAAFRSKETQILVVTDVAARGLDIPIMEHVLNYDLPGKPQQFLHRVGRTARAGRKGQALSIVTRTDLPHLLDVNLRFQLDLFQGGRGSLGGIPRGLVEDRMEVVRKLGEVIPDIPAQYGVLLKAQALYERSCDRASAMAYRTIRQGQIPDGSSLQSRINPLFHSEHGPLDPEHEYRDSLLHTIRSYRPQSRHSRGGSAAKSHPSDGHKLGSLPEASLQHSPSNASSPLQRPNHTFQDDQYWIGHSSLHGSSCGLEQLNAPSATISDTGTAVVRGRASQLKWDRKRKRFLQSRSDDAKSSMIKGENGTKLPATYRAGRYQHWKKSAGSGVTRRGDGNGVYVHGKRAVDQRTAQRSARHPGRSTGLLAAAAIGRKRSRAGRGGGRGASA